MDIVILYWLAQGYLQDWFYLINNLLHNMI